MKVEVKESVTTGLGQFIIRAIEAGLVQYAKNKSEWHLENRDKLIKISDLSINELIPSKVDKQGLFERLGIVYLLYTYPKHNNIWGDNYIFILMDKDFNIVMKMYDPVD